MQLSNLFFEKKGTILEFFLFTWESLKHRDRFIQEITCIFTMSQCMWNYNIYTSSYFWDSIVSNWFSFEIIKYEYSCCYLILTEYSCFMIKCVWESQKLELPILNVFKSENYKWKVKKAWQEHVQFYKTWIDLRLRPSSVHISKIM